MVIASMSFVPSQSILNSVLHADNLYSLTDIVNVSIMPRRNLAVFLHDFASSNYISLKQVTYLKLLNLQNLFGNSV